MLETLSVFQWSILALAALCIGMSKTGVQTEEGRIPPFMHPSVFLAEYFAPNHYSHRQGERPTHQLAESLCRDELVNKKCYEKA